jgi:hypothetical protein
MGRMLASVLCLIAAGAKALSPPAQPQTVPAYMTLDGLYLCLMAGLFGAWQMFRYLEQHHYICNFDYRPRYLLWCAGSLFAWKTILFAYRYYAP